MPMSVGGGENGSTGGAEKSPGRGGCKAAALELALELALEQKRFPLVSRFRHSYLIAAGTFTNVRNKRDTGKNMILVKL